jgi:flagellar protein FliO/FliZ
MPEDLNNILLAIAGFLFVIALIALTAWGFKAFVLSSGGRGGSGFLKGRDKRLGVVETASVDGRRKLIMIGGPVDMVIETGIFGRRSLDPPLQDVVIGQPDLGPPPDFGKLWPASR